MPDERLVLVELLFQDTIPRRSRCQGKFFAIPALLVLGWGLVALLNLFPYKHSQATQFFKVKESFALYANHSTDVSDKLIGRALASRFHDVDLDRTTLGKCCRGDDENPMNAAFLFIKPHAVTERVKALARQSLERGGINILAEGTLCGQTIDEKKLIDQHYYAIASKATILKPHELNIPVDKFEATFGITWQAALDSGRVFNAMDGCKHLGIDAHEMNSLWAKAKKVKLGGGFYCGLVEVSGKEPVYIFNAFFMAMRSKFTKASASIYWYSVEWDPAELSWADFRAKILGPTDPEDAPKDSLRGQILARWKVLGLKAKPNVGDNGMHASASPFEGFTERNNWLGVPVIEDPFGKRMLDSGLAESRIKEWSVDPLVNIGPGKTGSIFDQLEDMDAKNCLKELARLSRLNPAGK